MRIERKKMNIGKVFTFVVILIFTIVDGFWWYDLMLHHKIVSLQLVVVSNDVSLVILGGLLATVMLWISGCIEFE